ncbi:MAG: IcmT/TraK family protein [Pseudomonadota bacterium]|nr:IcmT/TraK family protein [Pseudomonadota bacterium]
MNETWHWRNSMRPVRFAALDARTAIPFVFAMIHFRQWTVILAFVVTMLFWWLERKGLTFDAALRAGRSWVFGRNRPAVIWTVKRRMIDWGSE